MPGKPVAGKCSHRACRLCRLFRLRGDRRGKPDAGGGVSEHQRQREIDRRFHQGRAIYARWGGSDHPGPAGQLSFETPQGPAEGVQPDAAFPRACRRISLRSIELKQLKILAEEQEVEYPLTLILCPSLLGKAIRSPSGAWIGRW